MDVWTWDRVYERLAQAPPGKLWGVPRGGQIVAGLTGRAVDTITDADVIVDDIIDSGVTLQRYQDAYQKPTWALVTKQPGGGWVHFPWEDADPLADLADTVRRQLEWLGEQPARPGLRATPARYLKALRDLTMGYTQDPAAILGAVFDEPCDEMIVIRDIPFFSLCEHHILPFHGHATVAYIPTAQRIVGLSKIPRLVQCFARRLQIQERLTQQIAHALYDHLTPLGVGVVLLAEHSCVRMRGIQSAGKMTTSCLLGVLKEATPRQEFLALVRQE